VSSLRSRRQGRRPPVLTTRNGTSYEGLNPIAAAVELPGIPGAWQLAPPSLPAPFYRCGYRNDDNDNNIRDGTSDYEVLQRWVSVNASKLGTVSRQEYASMLPVLLLLGGGDGERSSRHRVLDLCASPGSKTLQAVDALYEAATTEAPVEATETTSGNDEHGATPSSSSTTTTISGFVVANELEPKRAYVLARRCCKSPALSERHRSVAVCCHDATKFPDVRAGLVRQDSPSSKRLCRRRSPCDPIICDVPCSGEGRSGRIARYGGRGIPSSASRCTRCKFESPSAGSPCWKSVGS